MRHSSRASYLTRCWASSQCASRQQMVRTLRLRPERTLLLLSQVLRANSFPTTVDGSNRRGLREIDTAIEASEMSDQLEARARRISIEFLKACEPTHLAGEGSFIAFDPAVVDIPDWEVELGEVYEHSSFSLVGNRERRVTMCVHRLYQSWVVGFDHEHPARAQGRRGV